MFLENSQDFILGLEKAVPASLALTNLFLLLNSPCLCNKLLQIIRVSSLKRL